MVLLGEISGIVSEKKTKKTFAGVEKVSIFAIPKAGKRF